MKSPAVVCGLNKIMHKHDFSGTGLEPEELDRKRSFDCGNFSEAALDCKKKIYIFSLTIHLLTAYKKEKKIPYLSIYILDSSTHILTSCFSPS